MDSHYMPELVASILSADFTCLGSQMEETMQSGIQRVQVDIMDGHFVPNISMGPSFIHVVKQCVPLCVEAHLMIMEPDKYIPEVAESGADCIIVHQETCPHLYRTIQHIRMFGKKVGIALNPSTSAVLIEDILEQCDIVLVMTVNPGFGGQSFITPMIPKIQHIRSLLQKYNPDCRLEVDGGINTETIAYAVDAGADLLVTGSALYTSRMSIIESARLLGTAMKVQGGR